jgi:murein DD-endopeptidase MepM/ murein hydrolase activator NlpD
MFNGVVFPIEVPRVTMPFKATETKWYSEEKPHRGVDIAPFPGSTGRPVRMPCHGQVVKVGSHEFAGLEIITSHTLPYPFGAHALDKAVYTIEAHEPFFLRTTHHSKILAGAGDVIATGEVIAHIGNTGLYTTGPHVHLELHKYGYPGLVLNPIDFFIAAIPGLRASLVWPW